MALPLNIRKKQITEGYHCFLFIKDIILLVSLICKIIARHLKFFCHSSKTHLT